MVYFHINKTPTRTVMYYIKSVQIKGENSLIFRLWIKLTTFYYVKLLNDIQKRKRDGQNKIYKFVQFFQDILSNL